jgi:hypothetical protein
VGFVVDRVALEKASSPSTSVFSVNFHPTDYSILEDRYNMPISRQVDSVSPELKKYIYKIMFPKSG